MIENFVWAQLNTAPSRSDEQKTWFGACTELVHTDEALSNAAQLLSGELEIDGLPIDQDKRWQLIVLLNRHLHGDYTKLIEKSWKRTTATVPRTTPSAPVLLDLAPKRSKNGWTISLTSEGSTN